MAHSYPWRSACVHAHHQHAKQPKRHLELHSGLRVVCELGLIEEDLRRADLAEH